LDFEAGEVTLRLYMESKEDTYAETFLHLNIQVPTVTPTETPHLPKATPVTTETPLQDSDG
jgi:hypothetical protein